MANSLGKTEVDITEIVIQEADKSNFGPALRALVQEHKVRIVKRLELRVLQNEQGTLSVVVVDDEG